MNNHDRLQVLDTDTVSLIQRGREIVRRRIESVPPEQIAVTVITVAEQMRGRLADIHRAREGTPTLIYAYQRLRKTVDYYCNLTVLPFDAAAVTQLAELRNQKIRISTQDLRIAAIVLSVNGILVTCKGRRNNKTSHLIGPDYQIQTF